MNWFSRFLSELRRRNVVPTVIPYVGLVWLLLQVVSVIVPMLNLHPLVGTFSAVVLFAGFPVVCYLAWHFDFTRDGLKPVAEDEQGSVRPFGWTRWSLLMVILVVSIVAGYGYFNDVRQQFAREAEGISVQHTANSIAVLPFADQSPDRDQAFFAQGIAEELTSLLGGISELKVSASSSSRILSERGLDPVAIGRRLQVDTVLTGSVRLTGDQLKVRTELIDTSNGRTLWTETFARTFADIFEVETEISRSIVNLLQDTYLETGSLTNPANTKSTDAYVLYLKGREAYRLQTTEGIKEARKYFEQAIGLDPEYAQAYVALADTILLLEESNLNFGTLDTDVAVTLADTALQKAFVREPNHAYAYAVQGQLLDLQGKYDEGLQFYEKAISLNASLAIAFLWKGLNLVFQGQYDESLSALQAAINLDPLSITARFNMGTRLSRMGKFYESQQVFTRLIEDFPESPMGYEGLADAAFSSGEIALSMTLWKQAWDLSPADDYYRQNYLNTLVYLGLTDRLKRETQGQSHQTNIMILEGNFDEVFDYMAFQMKAAPEDPWTQFEAAWYQMLYGDKQIAADILIDMRPAVPDHELFSMPYCSPAIEVAWALKQKDAANAQTLLDRCQTLLDNALQTEKADAPLYYLGARLAALSGNAEKSVDMLNQAIELHWREYWSPQDPLLTELNQPKVNAPLQRIDDLLQQEREKALATLTTTQEQ